jgi:hypothetical protein
MFLFTTTTKQPLAHAELNASLKKRDPSAVATLSPKASKETCLAICKVENDSATTSKCFCVEVELLKTCVCFAFCLLVF